MPVAAEVADALHCDLDVIVAKKLGSPFSPELAVGAVTADGTRYVNDEVVRELQVSEDYMERETADRAAEAKEREVKFRGARPACTVEGRTVILVDDGLATGSTMIAAARSIRRQHPAKVIMAVPVGPAETCEAMHAEVDEVVCLATPAPFVAVGLYYDDFSQTTDEEVADIMRDHSPASTRRLAVPTAR
jgi:putative phosphoribosyl transferase